MDYYLVKTNAGFAAADERTEQLLKTFGAGEVIAAQIRRPRNIKHHRKFFALLNAIFQNQEKYLSVEAMRFALIIASGYAEEVQLEGDKVAMRPRSLNFASMDQTEFEAFYEAALQAVPRLLPQFDGVDIEREIVQPSKRW